MLEYEDFSKDELIFHIKRLEHYVEMLEQGKVFIGNIAVMRNAIEEILFNNESNAKEIALNAMVRLICIDTAKTAQEIGKAFKGLSINS